MARAWTLVGCSQGTWRPLNRAGWALLLTCLVLWFEFAVCDEQVPKLLFILEVALLLF